MLHIPVKSHSLIPKKIMQPWSINQIDKEKYVQINTKICFKSYFDWDTIKSQDMHNCQFINHKN